MQDEAGASDNRLSIDPSAFNGVAKDWNDGETYTAVVKMTQVSPGEFTIQDFKPASDEEANEPEAPEEPDTAESEGEPYPANRAVSKLMARK